MLEKLPHKYLELSYFALVLLIAFFIKHWYSQAALMQMQWMMQPLAMMLDQFTSGGFEVDAQGQWYNSTWNVILVKACSGLNFFIASFMVLAIAFKARVKVPTVAKLIACIGFAILLAWPVTLLANTARILTAMYFINHSELLQWTSLNDEQIHRFVGLVVYFPLLVCQLYMVRAFNLVTSYAISALVIVLLLIMVPLLTGNAFMQVGIFIEHVLAIFSVLLLVGLFCLLAEMLKKRNNEALNN